MEQYLCLFEKKQKRFHMKKRFTIIALLIFFTSCKDAKDSFVLANSVGKSNQLLVVTELRDWQGQVGQACLARDVCHAPAKPKLSLQQLQTNTSCDPNSGCC